METLASELAEALTLKEKIKAGEIAGDELDVSINGLAVNARELMCFQG